MLNEEKLSILDATDPAVMAYYVLRKHRKYDENYFNIFRTINELDMRVALADYGLDEDGTPLECCQFIPRNSHERGYIITSNNSSIERIRFDCAIMLYCAIKNRKKIAVYKPSIDSRTMHQAKIFAVNLLMPEKELKNFVYKKDENGKYLYLDENGKISIDNINYVANHFGVPFRTCAVRILNVCGNIENISTKEKLLSVIKNRNYQHPTSIKDSKYKIEMCEQLIDSLRYLKVERTKAIVLEKILRECVKNESLLEGVIKDTKGVNNILQIFATGGEIDENGVLHSKYGDKSIKLKEEQLIVLGNYEMLKQIAYEGPAYYTENKEQVVDEAINKCGYGLENEKKKSLLMDAGLKYLNGDSSYKDTCLFLKEVCELKERDIQTFTDALVGFDQYTILRFHKTLFKYSKEQDYIGGKYRTSGVRITGAKFETASPTEVPYVMWNLNCDIIDLLKRKDEYSNSEYINKVNQLVVRFLKIHPFQDGNGRVSRAITNFLYKKKHLPFVFINADKQREAYLDSLDEVEGQHFNVNEGDLTSLNIVMHNAIATSYSNIYEGSKMLTDPEKEISRSRLVNKRS